MFWKKLKPSKKQSKSFKIWNFFFSFFRLLQKPPQAPRTGRRGEGDVLQTPDLHGNAQIGRLGNALLLVGLHPVGGHADVPLEWFRTWGSPLRKLGIPLLGVPRQLLEEVDFLLVDFLLPPNRVRGFGLGDFIRLARFSRENGGVFWPEKKIISWFFLNTL